MSVAEELDIPLGSIKVWMDRFGKVHVVGCHDKDLEIEIIRKLDDYMRGNRNVVGAYNADTCFTVIPTSKRNKVSYDNIESAKNRILALRKEGFQVLRIIRSVEGSSQVYSIIMIDSTYYDGTRHTPGYQEVDTFDAEWMNYHGEYVWKYCA